MPNTGGYKGLLVILVVYSGLLVTELVKGDCDGIPEVLDSSNNATSNGTFPNNYVIRYNCDMGYRGFGNRSIYCIGNDWAGKFECLKTCGSVETPANGYVVGNPTYVVASTITFACNPGYSVEGTAVLRCRDNRNWRPSILPVCKPVDCGPFGSVDNGNLNQKNLDGVLNDYGSKIVVTCNDGYILGGTPTVTCESNGRWSTKPSCTFSSCGQHPGLDSKCIDEVDILESMITILCYDSSVNRSVTEIGGDTDYCTNNQWEHLDMGCFCDCMINTEHQGVIYNNLHGQFVKHGTELNWYCQSGYKKNSTINRISCNDGDMEQPQCIKIENDCMVNTEHQGVNYNNSDAKFVKHGSELNWYCQSGYKKNSTINRISCNDGDMEQPQCIKIEKDCMVNTEHQGVNYNNSDAKFVKHGTELNWYCQSGYMKNSTINRISCNDGDMEQPQCIKIENDCMINTEHQGVNYNNSDAKFVKHGTELNWYCQSGYMKNSIINRISCHDGDMEQPQCIKITNGSKLDNLVKSFEWCYVLIIVCIIGLVVGIIIGVLVKCNVIKCHKNEKSAVSQPEELPLKDQNS